MPERFPYPVRDAAGKYLKLFLTAIGASGAPARRADRQVIVMCKSGLVRRGLMLAIVIATTPGAALAQPAAAPRVVTLEDALEMAGASSEQLAIASAGVRRAEGEEVRAGADRFPQLSAAASYDRALASEFSGLFGGGPPPLPIRSALIRSVHRRTSHRARAGRRLRRDRRLGGRRTRRRRRAAVRPQEHLSAESVVFAEPVLRAAASAPSARSRPRAATTRRDRPRRRPAPSSPSTSCRPTTTRR